MIIFLVAIDDKLIKHFGLDKKKRKKKSKPDVVTDSGVAEYKPTDETVVPYSKLEKKVGKVRKQAPKPSRKERLKSFLGNVKNVTYNALDKIIGKPIAYIQNKKTERALRKGDSKNVVYLMAGTAQGPENQWRLSKKLRKEGFLPYHLKPHNKLSRKEAAEKGFEQIKGLHKKAGIKSAKGRSDYASGHSSGADKFLYMAGDKRIRDYGIKKVQAIAPVPYGVGKGKTLGQRLLLPLAEGDDATKKAGRKHALATHKRELQIPAYVVSGLVDRLVRPQDAAYLKAEGHHVIRDTAATHFGTSGSNNQVNQYLASHIKLIAKQNEKKKRLYRK